MINNKSDSVVKKKKLLSVEHIANNLHVLYPFKLDVCSMYFVA